MRPCYKLTIVVALLAVLAVALTPGCKDDSGLWGLAVGKVLQSIIAPAVTDAWPLLVERLAPLGLYNEATDKFELGQEQVVGWLMALVPAAQEVNRQPAAVKAQATAEHEARVKSQRTLIAPLAPRAASE